MEGSLAALHLMHLLTLSRSVSSKWGRRHDMHPGHTQEAEVPLTGWDVT